MIDTEKDDCNETKLTSITKRYRVLRLIADISPFLAAFLQLATLSVSITMITYVVRIQASEKAQDLAREATMKSRAERQATEQKILEKQAQQLQIINNILLNQVRDDVKGVGLNSATLDSLKVLFLNSQKIKP